MEQMDFAYELEVKFGALLMKHVQRLAATAAPAVDFPVNAATLACSTLITERENQLKNNELMQRFTREDLFQEISELGVPMNGNWEKILHVMEKEGYLRIQDDGFLQGEPQLIEFCNVLDKIFPRMRGLNLVAYLVQTIEEVVSGRKDSDEAQRQLDQVLEMHGVPFSPSKEDHTTGRSSLPPSKPQGGKARAEAKKKKKDLGDKNRETMLKLLQVAARQERRKRTVSSSALIRPGEGKSEDQKKRRLDGEGSPLQVHPEKRTESAMHEPGNGRLEDTDLIDVKSPPRENAETNLPGDEPTGESGGESTSAHEDAQNEPFPQDDHVVPVEETQIDQKEEAGEEEEKESQALPILDDRMADDALHTDAEQEETLSEKDIEERIAAFEEDLALACPLCGQGKIEVRETSQGKRFYECSSDGCYFISWGKPYHLDCPKCRNNFLIEAVDAGGRAFLKCPRATCDYKQNLPGEDGPFKETEKKGKRNKDAIGEKQVRKPAKKVVRRRVVRRRK